MSFSSKIYKPARSSLVTASLVAMALEEYEPDSVLFLAVPIEIYNTFFQRPFIQKVITRKQVKIIIYDPSVETIESWIK